MTLWNLPGGGLEKGETPWQGVIREVKEETGFNVEILKLIGLYSKSAKNEIIFSFECKITDGKITLNDEAKDIQYFSLNEIPKNTSPRHVERIKDFFESKEAVVMKVQTGKPLMDLVKDGLS